MDRSPSETIDDPIVELRRMLIDRRKRRNPITLLRKLFNDRRELDRRVAK